MLMVPSDAHRGVLNAADASQTAEATGIPGSGFFSSSSSWLVGGIVLYAGTELRPAAAVHPPVWTESFRFELCLLGHGWFFLCCPWRTREMDDPDVRQDGRGEWTRRGSNVLHSGAWARIGVNAGLFPMEFTFLRIKVQMEGTRAYSPPGIGRNHEHKVGFRRGRCCLFLNDGDLCVGVLADNLMILAVESSACLQRTAAGIAREGA